MPLEQLQNEVLNNTETSDHIRQETNRLLAEANDIFRHVEEMGGDVEAVKKEYEDVRLATIQAMKETSEEAKAITQIELGSLRKEVNELEISKSLYYNKELEILLKQYEDLNLPINEIEKGLKKGEITVKEATLKLKLAGLEEKEAVNMINIMIESLGLVRTIDQINIEKEQKSLSEGFKVNEEMILNTLKKLGIENEFVSFEERDMNNGNYFSSIDEILDSQNILDDIISKLKDINITDNELNKKRNIILNKLIEYRKLKNKELLGEYNIIQQKRQIEELKLNNSKEISNETTKGVNTNETNNNYIISENIVTTDKGKQIKLNQEEQKMVSDNPEALDNLVNFYGILDDANMLGFWDIRGDIFKAIGELGFDYEDGNYLDQNEIKLFLNTILKSIEDKLEGEEIPSTNLSFNDYIARIKVLNKSSVGPGKIEDTNLHGDSYLMNIFKNKFVDYNSTLINFNTGDFLESIK